MLVKIIAMITGLAADKHTLVGGLIAECQPTNFKGGGGEQGAIGGG